MSPKINSINWENRPPGHYYGGERIDYRPGETFGEAILRHQNAKAATKPTALAKPEPNREQQNANGELLKSNAAEIAQLRELAAKQPAPKPAAVAPVAEQPPKPVALAEPDAEPRQRTGFASKIQMAKTGFNAFGKHPQMPE